MSTATANINVSVNGLGQLDTLDKKLQGLGTRFSGLKTALAGVGFAAFGRSALMMADDLSDLSNATGIAIGRLLEYQDALVAAGGQADQMAGGIVKFTQSIDEAAQGSLKTQSAFAELNVTLQDLRTLSETDLLSKALQGFDKITDKSREAALKMDIFGKSFRTVDPREMVDKLNQAAGSGDKYGQSIKEAAALNDKMAKSMMDLKIAFLQVTAPLVEMVNKISDGGKNIETLVTIIKTLGIVLLSVFGGGLLMAGVRVIGTLGRSISAVAGMFKKIPPAAKEAAEGVAEAATKMTNRFEPGSRLMRALRGAAVLIGSIGGAALGMIGLGGAGDAKPEAGAGAGAGAGAESAANREVTDALAKKRQEIQNITKAFKDQNNQLVDNINVEKMLVGKSQEEADIIRAQEEIYKRAASESDKLRLAKQALGKDEQGLITVYDAQIKKIQEQSEIDVARVSKAMSGLHGLKLLEQDRLNNIERINQALQKQIAYDQSLLQIRQQTQSQIGEAEFEGAQMKRSPLEKQFAQIQENARKAALEAGRAFSEQFSAEDMGAEDAKKLSDGLALIAQRYQDIANVQSANLGVSRTWATGWKDAFNSYMDSATNAAKMAGEQFNAVTNGMNSAIDKFVESGKFSFKDMANSIIKDLLRIELKKQAAMAISGAGSFLGSLFGFANGGQPPINKPSIVGEKGPELFVPKTAGTIVPNNQLGGGSQTINNNYVYNVSAIDARSVATFFAENRKTMLGTIQMAQKELPYGNR
jgi:lambda family phage tail tape measure protein